MRTFTAGDEERQRIIDNLTREQEDLLREAFSKQFYGSDDDMGDVYEGWLMALDLADLKRILSL